MIQDHAASVNRFDIAARRIADVVLKQPTGFQVKLLNSTDGRVDHWLTVVAAGSPDLVPFFGTVQPRTLQVERAERVRWMRMRRRRTRFF